MYFSRLHAEISREGYDEWIGRIEMSDVIDELHVLRDFKPYLTVRKDHLNAFAKAIQLFLARSLESFRERRSSLLGKLVRYFD